MVVINFVAIPAQAGIHHLTNSYEVMVLSTYGSGDRFPPARE